MSVESLALFGLFLTALIRPLVFKSVGKKISHFELSATSGFFMVLGMIVLAPLFQTQWIGVISDIQKTPSLAVLGIGKGIVLGVAMSATQYIAMQNITASQSIRPLSLLLLAVGNSFLGEQLSTFQWSALIAIFILGAIYVYKGDIRSMSKKTQISFVIAALTASTLGMFDHVILTQTHWLSLILFSGIGMMIGSRIFGGVRFSFYMKALNNPTIFGIGVFWTVTEIFILSVLVTVVPVTIGATAMRLALPVVILIGSIRWQEGHWALRTAYGSANCAAMVALIST